MWFTPKGKIQQLQSYLPVLFKRQVRKHHDLAARVLSTRMLEQHTRVNSCFQERTKQNLLKIKCHSFVLSLKVACSKDTVPDIENSVQKLRSNIWLENTILSYCIQFVIEFKSYNVVLVARNKNNNDVIVFTVYQYYNILWLCKHKICCEKFVNTPGTTDVHSKLETSAS